MRFLVAVCSTWYYYVFITKQTRSRTMDDGLIYSILMSLPGVMIVVGILLDIKNYDPSDY
jgi:hypothetical protein